MTRLTTLRCGSMASLLIRTSDDAIDIDIRDLDDETLAQILVTIDESLERRAGLWVHSQDFEDYGQPNRMLWLSADQLDIKATFDGETPPPAGALATTVRETSSGGTSAAGGLFGS
jgi:ABC-type metal ion transport system substrate-binding protein